MPPIDPATTIGHIHLKVADLERAIAFYRDVLGFQLMQRFGNSAAFLSAGGYHHHIGLNTWDSKNGTPPARGTTGLYHAAILYPSRPALADASAASSPTRSPSTAPPTTASPKPSTSATPTTTASNSTATAP